MKHLAFRFNLKGLIRIALMVFMISTIINLYGQDEYLKECPVNISYKVKPLSWKLKEGSKLSITYTISMKSIKVTKFDKQRKYRLTSDYFDERINWILSSDIRNNQIFTYSQFPIKGHIKIIFTGYGDVVEDPLVYRARINVEGLYVKGDSSVCYHDYNNALIQQHSTLDIDIPMMGMIDLIKDLFRLDKFYIRNSSFP